MKRPKIETADGARSDVPSVTRPAWLARQVKLPFENLSPDEFEVFSFLLLVRELEASPEPGVALFYYGKTGDRGRDIVRLGVSQSHLIQCKHFGGNVGVGEVRAELAKLFVNVHNRAIETPDVVEFYVTTDLTSDAQDLLRSREKWNGSAEKALTEYLRESGGTLSQDLLKFAKTWRPSLRYQSGLSLTERARKRHAEGLLDEFFEIRKVVDVGTLEKPLEEIAQKIDLLLASRQTLAQPLDDRLAVKDFLRRYLRLLTQSRGYILSQAVILNRLTDLDSWRRAQVSGALRQFKQLSDSRSSLWTSPEAMALVGSVSTVTPILKGLTLAPTAEDLRQRDAWERWSDLLLQLGNPGPQNDEHVQMLRRAGGEFVDASLTAFSTKARLLEDAVSKWLADQPTADAIPPAGTK